MLQVPLEIAFHNLDSIPWAEEEIRARVAKLEKIYDRLVSCRVRVDQRNDNSNHTIPPVVRIEMGIPGRKDLVVSHEPNHLQQKFQAPDLHNAINEAFRIAEDQLADFKEQIQGRTKEIHHHSENQMLGQVADIDPSGDFGFVLTNSGGMLYFHRNSLLSGDFEKLKRGTAVHYVEEMGDTGPTAAKVRVKANGNGNGNGTP
jgi:cold shock CspA family protein/ribosome-associated translation inhibitor RaiA